MSDSVETKEKSNPYTIWVERYRPAKIAGILLPKSFKQFFTKILEDKEIPNLMLFSSTPGTGKTSIAKALAKEVGADYIYINTSLENGIDVLRSRIEKFATSMSFNGNKKIVIMDEFDGASNSLQSALRATIEEFHQSCRFIFTCNYITKIIEPLKSRCQLFDFNMNTIEIQNEMKPLVVGRLSRILDLEKMTYNKDILVKIVDMHYPDIRKMINLLQQYTKQNNGIINEAIFDYDKVDTELYDLILNKKLTAARKYIIERNYNPDEMYRQFFDQLVPMLKKEAQAPAILLIAHYMDQSSHSIDKEITLTALILEIIGLI